MNFENNLRRIRKALGLKTTELAKMVGLTQPQITRLENCNRKLSLYWANKLADVLEVSPAEIIGKEALGLSDSNNPLDRVSEVLMVEQDFACGEGCVPLDYPETEKLTFPQSALKQLINTPVSKDNIHIVNAKGESMLPFIKDGDKVFINTTDTEVRNTREKIKSVFAFRYNGYVKLKHLAKTKEGYFAKSLNKKFTSPEDNFKINPKEQDFAIIGKVVGVMCRV